MTTKLFNFKARWLLVPLVLLTLGVGNAWGDTYSLVVSKAALEDGAEYILLVNNRSTAYNGSISSGHLQTGATWSSSSTTAGSAVTLSSGSAYKIQLVKISGDTYKIKDVSNNKFIRASDAKSGSFYLNASDNYGWTFTGTSSLNAQYQETSKKAYLRSYSNNSFRSYANTSSGQTFYLAKVISGTNHTLSSAVSPVGGGGVALSATSVAEGSTATATATPATHYVFDHWSISGTGSTLSSTTTNPTTVTMGTANTTVTATFVAAPKASITLSEAGATTTDATTYYVGDTYTLPSSTSAVCGTKVLVGWSTVTVAETNTKPSSNFYEKGAEVTLGATQTFYAVFATESAGGTPTAYSAEDEGTFVLASYNTSNSKWYAIPTRPTLSSNKIAGVEITVNTTGGVDYVSTANASGYEWTIADHDKYGQTISDGSKYLYHSNGGASGTDLAYGNSTNYSWVIASETGGLTFQGAIVENGTPSTRGLLMSGTTFGGYALSNEGNSGYYRIQVLPISDGTTYSAYSTTCADSYTLTFKEWDGGGTASGSPSTGTVSANATSFSFGATPPSKDGYQIEGFYTNTSASSGVKVANSDRTFIASIGGWTNSSSEYTKAANANLYIKWEVKHYTITYNAGEYGTGTISAGDKTHGESFTLSSSTFTRDGYTQDGWSTSDGGDKVYDLGGSYTANADITLYPHWVINNYTVSWSVNGSNWTSGVTASNNNANHGSTVSAPTAPTSSDCDDSKVFVGWTNAEYEDEDEAPAVLFTGTSSPITENTTFYAVFAESSGGGVSFDHYEKVTSAPDDWTAHKYVIATANDGVVLTGQDGSSNWGTYATMSTTTERTSAEITMTEVSTGVYKLYQNSKYLALNSNGNNLYFTDTYTGSDGTNNKCDWKIYNFNSAYIVESPLKYTIGSNTNQYRAIQYNATSGQERFACYKHNSQTVAYLYKRVESGSVSYSNYATTCCQQPATQLAIAADKTELVRSGAVNFTLSGGNGQDITWSCRDEADANCDALLTATSNSGATLTISSPVSATKTYTVTATQPEDDDDAEVVCGKTVTMDITVKAQWTITFQTTDEGTPITYDTQTVTDGESYIFPDLSDDYTCETNYSFVGWKAENTAGAPEYAAGSSATASGNKTWYAVWMRSNGTTTQTRDKYELITSASAAIDENDVVVIACSSQGVALRQMTTSDTYGSPVAVDFAANKSYLTFASGTNVMELKLESRSGGYWYFTDNNSDDIYINYNGSGGSLIYDDEYRWYWSISFNDAGTATISDPEEGYTDFKIQYKSDNTRFAFYSGTGSVYKNVQLYRKNGTISVSVPNDPDYYVNNEHCDGGASIRAANNQWVTSSKDQKVRITIPVTAKNFTNSDRSMTASSDNDHFIVSIPSTTIPSGSTGLTTNLTVEYTPVAANTTEEANITITTGTGTDHATKVITVNGRSLPDEFVIVTYKDSKWQALPANMFNGSGTYTPITVTPNAGPTKVPSAPYTTIYSARGVATSRYETAGNCMRLVGNNNKCLWANSTSNNSHIQNWGALGSTNGAQYEWLLTTTDGEQYTIADPAHPDYATGRQLAINTLYYGLYKTDAIFYLLPVDCSTQPGNLQITPRRVDATFSWETNASTVTIDLYTNEGMTEGHKTASVTDVPYLFSSLAENTQYWYKLTPDADDDCAVTGTFKTTGPVIDVVEWGENSATIYVDKDEAVDPRIIIAGEVEHGQGGIVATDIFFSKYFEAEGTAKLLAIYNGTANAISLADITILQRTSAKNTPLSLASYGKTAGWIQPGEEIVLFNRDSRDAVMECAENNETYDSWINVEDNNLSFSGKGTIRLFRGNTCIDIIGAMNAGDNAANMNDKTRDPMEGAASPSFGDAKGFVTLFGDNYKTPTEETDYKLSTNRCLLIRRAFVTSGDSALLNNFGDFKTLGTYTGVDSKTHKGEWSGLQIPTAEPPETDYIHTCAGFEDAGSFDYNKYYKEFITFSDDKYLSNFTRADDGTYTLSIEYMRQYACMNLKFQLTAHNDPTDVLTEQLVQVPIVVKDARNSNDTLFNNIIKQDVEPHAPMVPESINRCKTCNVVVLGTGTLTKVADGSTNDVAEIRDVKVYPGGKLIIPEGTHYVVNSLALRRQEDVVAAAKINSGLADDPDDITDKGIYIRESNGVYLDVRIDPSKWHYFTLPYDCRVGDVRFADGTPAKVNTDYLISWYDGAYRAEHKTGGWTDITSDDYVLKAGLGYIVALPGSGLIKRELRFPMANNVIAEELGDKTVGGLYAYGGDKTDEELRPNHKGWNMIGNPYLYDYTTDIVTDPLAVGELEHDPSGSSWNGKWVRTGSARYIVAPIDDNGWKGYEQTTISNLRPFMSYFIQVGTKTDGTENPETERSITFDKDQKPASIIRRAQAEDAEPMYPVWYGLELLAPNGEKDNTTLLISNEFTDDYDMMDDLIKMRGSYYNYYQNPVLASRNNSGEMAFNALPDSSAAVIGVPLNYYAYQAGTYTFATDSRYDLEEVKSAMLFDATTQQYYDLLTENHSFSLAKGDNNARFKLYVRVERKKPQITTDVDNLLVDGQLSLIALDKTLVLSGLTDAADIYVYDATGKLIRSDLSASGGGIWRTNVPAQGVYFVRVNSTTSQQTLRTVVK